MTRVHRELNFNRSLKVSGSCDRVEEQLREAAGQIIMNRLPTS